MRLAAAAVVVIVAVGGVTTAAVAPVPAYAVPGRAGAASITVADATLTRDFCSPTTYVYSVDPPQGHPDVTVYVTASTPELGNHAGDRQFGASGSGTLAFCGATTPGQYQAYMTVVACAGDGSDCVQYNSPTTFFQLFPAPPAPPQPVDPVLRARLDVTKGPHRIAIRALTFLSRRGDRERISARIELQVHVGSRWVRVARARTSAAGRFTWRADRPRGVVELRVEARARGQVAASPAVSHYY